MIGARLGHYQVLEKLGRGGMGEVYRAYDEHLSRDVAIKVLPPGTLNDAPAREQFRTEALALSKLNHPNVETVHDFDTQDGVDFLVIEYVPGQSLELAPVGEGQWLLIKDTKSCWSRVRSARLRQETGWSRPVRLCCTGMRTT